LGITLLLVVFLFRYSQSDSGGLHFGLGTTREANIFLVPSFLTISLKALIGQSFEGKY